MNAGWKVRYAGGIAALLLIGYGLLLALRISPPDANQGSMIRAFYYHFPNWIGASIFLPLNLIASLLYLATWKRTPLLAMKTDSLALACAEMGVVYCGLGLLTGSLWGRVEWGIWWTWAARLTTTLMLWLSTLVTSWLEESRQKTPLSFALFLRCLAFAIFQSFICLRLGGELNTPGRYLAEVRVRESLSECRVRFGGMFSHG